MVKKPGAGCARVRAPRARNGENMSFNTKRILALVVVVLAAVFSGLVTLALTNSRAAVLFGVVAGAVVGLVVVRNWLRGSF